MVIRYQLTSIQIISESGTPLFIRISPRKTSVFSGNNELKHIFAQLLILLPENVSFYNKKFDINNNMNLIDRINKQLRKTGFAPRSVQARDWLRQKVKELTPSNQNLMKDRQRLVNSSVIGGMFFFYYDPKTKDTLPYYDRFPLVLPIEQYSDGILGLNLHYIHPKQRIFLLDALSQYASNSKYDQSTRLRLSYDLLSRTSIAFKPCVKRYLFNHVRSRFLQIDADEWDIAALLPVSQFVGASESKVWSDSRKY